ncbi:MAG: Rho termination factor N-terminal domain-containing protein [Solirubrobacteraceae bacterium]
MTTVLERSELDASPLADLHAIADQIGLDGFRRLRKADLIDAILERSGGGAGDGDVSGAGDGNGDRADDGGSGRRARGGRAGGGRPGRARAGGEPTGDGGGSGTGEDEGAGDKGSDEKDSGEQGSGEVGTEMDVSGEERESGPRTARRRRPTRTRRARGAAGDQERDSEGATAREEEPRGGRGRAPRATAEERIAEGVVELLGNGSAFLRVSPPEASDEDVYISAAQVRRCELVSGDRVSGPVRTPRQSERYSSLARVDTINGAPADSVAEGTRYEDLAVAYPSERLELDPQDPTLGAIEWLTPVGRGSRATIVGEARAGKTETLRRLLGALAGKGTQAAGASHPATAGGEGLEVMLALAGVRPEEIAAWREGPVAPAAALDLGASAELQAQTVEHVVDTAKRVAARGGHVVVLVDTLDHLPPHAARRILAGARNLVEGGSLTLIATATRPLGGESTVIALDVALTSTGRIPALDLAASGVVRPELLVGEDGAAAITKARASALAG